MYKLINYIIIIILVYLFYRKLFLEFYAWFEVSLIPISLIIIGWGYQPERLPAFINIILYTIVCSLPFLLVILIFSVNNLEGRRLWKRRNQVIFIERIIIRIAFLVKFPIFFLHVWLPKAHVEAPVGGSMVLAGLLLKIGGFGVFILAPFSSSRGVLFLVLRLALGGGAVVSILCLRQVDRKTLVAYSSVAHIALVIRGIISITQLGVVGSFIVIFAHGVTSSAIFYIIYIVYLSCDSRNLILSKSLLICQPVLTMYIFILCARNMGAPPFFNLLAELCCAVVVGRMRVINFWLLGVLFFFAVAFNLVLYLYIRHGQNYSGAQDLKAISVIRNFVFLLHLV
jgi:NADH-ubiquinone oxidoreductase chain 4